MDSLWVTVHTREGIVFEGNARAVTGKNTVGLFDVLPMHANFVTTLFTSVTVHAQSEKSFTTDLDRGLLWARSGNLIDIYIGIGGNMVSENSENSENRINQNTQKTRRISVSENQKIPTL